MRGHRGRWLQPLQKGWQEGRHCRVAHGEAQQVFLSLLPAGNGLAALGHGGAGTICCRERERPGQL